MQTMKINMEIAELKSKIYKISEDIDHLKTLSTSIICYLLKKTSTTAEYIIFSSKHD